MHEYCELKVRIERHRKETGGGAQGALHRVRTGVPGPGCEFGPAYAALLVFSVRLASVPPWARDPDESRSSAFVPGP